MVSFFQTPSGNIIAVQTSFTLNDDFIQRLTWAFSGATDEVSGFFVGPRREMITPWSTNAVEITQNMGIEGIVRIEEFFPVAGTDAEHDSMLQRIYNGLNQRIFTIDKTPEPIIEIDDIEAYNQQEGLALSEDEVEYLNSVSNRLGRKLTDNIYH